uniref:DUF3427 domain-containing protein n=1 Tax=uncultured Allisonella sp. TaxID=339338 RepID=UPI00259987D4|nr:DEAD/DEAH box helicase [uncultured Allisonella sp.]
MSDIQHLPDGIYEEVVSQSLEEKIKKALADKTIWANFEDLDSHEAVPYLAKYLEKLVRLTLKDIADEDRTGKESKQREVSVINRLIQELVKQADVLQGKEEVVKENFLLTSLEHRRNKIKEQEWVRPETPLTRSFLFTNDKAEASMASELSREILSSDRIDFLVSFIKFSGLTMILPDLRRFTERGGQLRVITTTYMGATDAKAVKVLTELPNTEVRMSHDMDRTRLHAKAYMFHRNSGFSTAYVGSSNLSHAAIADGLEWNMKIAKQDMPEVMRKMEASFEGYWHSPGFNTVHTEDIEALEAEIDAVRNRGKTGSQGRYYFEIKPYTYQQAILDALWAERIDRNHWRNLVVAATGTGKTAISAFDYRSFCERQKKEGKTARLLFVAHRKEILEQSIQCFRQALKNPQFGDLAVGEYKAKRTEHLFISVQTLNSLKLWEKMDPAYYDMIIVDEFHHAAAASYQKLLSYFKPKILLGLTATPERMDGKSILKYFDGHLAAEIRLPDAIEKRLLCPFHYFGVTDAIDLTHVKWTNGHYDNEELTRIYALDRYTADKRAGQILGALDRYTADIRDVKALGFCVSKKHAHFMAEYFEKHNIPAMALDADSKKEERDSACTQLASGELKCLFVVDLFNEGVDIPEVNTVLFLRPTNSMTVFLQQLGRGLRLSKGKDCLTVLDFVAQANTKYDFASRFSSLLGKRHVQISKEIKNKFPHVPKGCSIQLEEIAEKNILDNIRKRLRNSDFYKELVQELYCASDRRVPHVQEFFKAAGIEPEVFYNGKRTFTRLCIDAGIIPPFSDKEGMEKIVAKAMPKIISMDSPKWIRFIQQSLVHGPVPISAVQKQYIRMWQYTLWMQDYDQAGMKSPWDALTRLSEIKPLAEEVNEVLEMQYGRVEVIPMQENLPYTCALDVYSTYTRNQILAALGYGKPGSVREGVRYLTSGNSDVVTVGTDVLLITLNKTEKEFSQTTLYEDYAIDKNLFHWQSQNKTRPESATGQRYIHQREKGNIVLLFVRGAKVDAYKRSMPYTFLGAADIASWQGSQPMSIIYKLRHPIPAKYLRETAASGVI